MKFNNSMSITRINDTFYRARYKNHIYDITFICDDHVWKIEDITYGDALAFLVGHAINLDTAFDSIVFAGEE